MRTFRLRHKIDDNYAIEIYNHVKRNRNDLTEVIFENDIFVSLSTLAILFLVRTNFPKSVDISIESTGSNLRNFFDNMGFWEPKRSTGTNYPLQHINIKSDNNQIIGAVPTWVRRFATATFNNKSASLGEVQQICFELYNNAIDHSSSKFGAVFCGTWLRHLDQLQIVMVDFGATIPTTLKPAFQGKELNDHEILTASLEPSISRRLGQSHNFGMGLNLVKRYALYDDNCTLKIISGNGFLSISEQKLHAREAKTYFQGTMVNCCVSRKFIEDAITVDEETHDFEL